jgi:antitoxin CcdA
MRQKVSCNTTINRALVNEAKSLDIKLSEVFEAALLAEVKARKRDNWLNENASAIQKHNQKIREHGTFSEKISQFDD